MYTYTHGNIVRQKQALLVLKTLLEEEFAQLRDREPEAVTATEFSIHELMRQLAVERMELKEMLGGQRLAEVMQVWSDDEQQILNDLLANIDNAEQACARQAALNTELALALHDQSQSLIEHIQEQMKPKKQTYGNKGRYTEVRPEATLLHGRL